MEQHCMQLTLLPDQHSGRTGGHVLQLDRIPVDTLWEAIHCTSKYDTQYLVVIFTPICLGSLDSH